MIKLDILNKISETCDADKQSSYRNEYALEQLIWGYDLSELIRTDYPSIKEIEKRISDLDLAIKYTKHSKRLHINKRNLKNSQKELDYKVFQCNKFSMFDYISNEVDKIVEQEMSRFFN